MIIVIAFRFTDNICLFGLYGRSSRKVVMTQVTIERVICSVACGGPALLHREAFSQFSGSQSTSRA